MTNLAKDQSKRTWPGDLLAGFCAIVAVLAVSIRAAIVGSDLRVMIGISMFSFFAAGMLRGRRPGGSLWARALITSCPGFLGTAALIVNDGFHRWPIPLAVTSLSILWTVLGIQARRSWVRSRGLGVVFGGASALVIPVVSLFFVPALVTFSSVKAAHVQPAHFAIRLPGGELVASEQLRGRVVVLASWASWCLPCRWELPELDRVYRTFQSDQRLAFFAVDRLGDAESPIRAKRYLDKARVGLPLAFETPGYADVLGADALPTLVILDREGRVRAKHYGYDSSEHLDEWLTRTVNQLLAERAS